MNQTTSALAPSSNNTRTALVYHAATSSAQEAAERTGEANAASAPAPDWANWERTLSILPEDQLLFVERMEDAARNLKLAEPRALSFTIDSRKFKSAVAARGLNADVPSQQDVDKMMQESLAFQAFLNGFVAYESFAYIFVPQRVDEDAYFPGTGTRMEFSPPLLHHLPATIAALLAMDAAVVRGHLSEMLANLNLNHDAGLNGNITWLVPSEMESGQPTSLTFVPADFNSWSALLLVVLEVKHLFLEAHCDPTLVQPPRALATYDALTMNALLEGLKVLKRSPAPTTASGSSASASANEGGEAAANAGTAAEAAAEGGTRGATAGASPSASASAPDEQRVRSLLNADVSRLHRIDPFVECRGGRRYRVTYEDASNAQSVFEYTVRTIILLLTAIHFDMYAPLDFADSEQFMNVRADLLRRVLGSRGRWPSRH